MSEDKRIGVYIHIPFCASKCAYCDFCSLPGKEKLMPHYQDAILIQLQETLPQMKDTFIDSVYFGGGTPSYYGSHRLVEILRELKVTNRLLKDSEITVECNPDSVRRRDLAELKKEGVNRLSIGAQCADDELLRLIGRRHNWHQVELAVRRARAAGFKNISLDLIYGLPSQTREDWADTLTKALALKPAHISCYGLRLEEGTPLYEEYLNSPILPSEDDQADMYLYAVDLLQRHGFRQYEISNFARTGMESRHNLKYWMGDEYLGFGASAASWLGGKRFTVLPDVEGYIAAIHSGGEPMSELEEVSLYEQASEYVMLRMRTARGMDPKEYESRYQNSFEPLEKLMESYVRLGLAQRVGERWRFTPRGFLLSNRLIGELLDAQAEQKYHMGIPWRKEDYYDTLF